MLIPKLFNAKVGLIIRVIGGYIPSYLKDFFRTLSCYAAVPYRIKKKLQL